MEAKLNKIEAELVEVIEDIMALEKYSPDYKAKLLSDANVTLTCLRILKAKVEL